MPRRKQIDQGEGLNPAALKKLPSSLKAGVKEAGQEAFKHGVWETGKILGKAGKEHMKGIPAQYVRRNVKERMAENVKEGAKKIFKALVSSAAQPIKEALTGSGLSGGVIDMALIKQMVKDFPGDTRRALECCKECAKKNIMGKGAQQGGFLPAMLAALAPVAMPLVGKLVADVAPKVIGALTGKKGKGATMGDWAYLGLYDDHAGRGWDYVGMGTDGAYRNRPIETSDLFQFAQKYGVFGKIDLPENQHRGNVNEMIHNIANDVHDYKEEAPTFEDTHITPLPTTLHINNLTEQPPREGFEVMGTGFRLLPDTSLGQYKRIRYGGGIVGNLPASSGGIVGQLPSTRMGRGLMPSENSVMGYPVGLARMGKGIAQKKNLKTSNVATWYP